MKSVMKHQFSEVPQVKIPRSTFNRSHGYMTTFEQGYLNPIYLDEALPGDTFMLNMAGFARLATPIFPIMDNMFMETFFFAVPMRLVWENWQKFCGEKVNPSDSTDYTIPIIDDVNNAQIQTIYDYMGVPTEVVGDLEISALPFRAYNLIYNEWFRDQNLQNSLPVAIDDGPDSMATYYKLRRNKKHDYFTSCLPWLQKGDAVQISLGESAPITGLGLDTQVFSGAKSPYETDGSGTSSFSNAAWYNYNNLIVEEDPDNTGYPNIRANLADAVAGTVNEWRQAIQVQALLERNARAGTRYTEIIESHFGVTSPDHRLQRPEYLGGGVTPVNISAVARTDSSPGVLGGIGVTQFRNHGFVKSFTEHCIIIGLVTVRCDLKYQEGLDRMFSRRTIYDFYWPQLQHLGEQAVLNKEIYVDAASIADGSIEDVFGYQERYAEYKYKPSKITGQFRSGYVNTLDAWHLGIEFGSQPTLNASFLYDNSPVDRCIAVPTEPHFIFDSYVNLKCVRPMAVYSIPGLNTNF